MNRVFAPDKSLFERRWPPSWRWPTDLRKFMFWVFGLTSLGCIALILYTIPHARKIPLIRSALAGPIFLVHMAAGNGGVDYLEWKILGERLRHCRKPHVYSRVSPSIHRPRSTQLGRAAC
jgi:hypothetical protein